MEIWLFPFKKTNCSNKWSDNLLLLGLWIMPAKESNKDSKMTGHWKQDADRIGNVAKHLWKIMIFVERVLIIPKHIYIKILNECENVITKLQFFSKIAINYKSNYSVKNVIRSHYLIT